ncbi:MAG: helix-turn-helix transcriptional regulator [Oscillospiraceae bacterium]|nr:helix-turn-helix transcriptional regulator [Oscillospiraceae bacterium]
MAKVLLSKLLGERRWTQAKLSEVTGIRANTVNLLYWDFTDSVKFEHLDKICKALGCTLTDLVQLDEKVELVGKPYIEPPPIKKRG